MNDETSPKPESKANIVTVYALLCAAVILLFVPLVPAMTMGALLLPFTLLTAWFMRFGKVPDSMTYQHMIYISRTIWTWSFIATISTSVAGFAVFTLADNSIYDKIIADMMNGVSYSRAMMREALMTYIHSNFTIIAVAGILCFVPIAGYILYRLYHGLGRALKGYRPHKPLSWL